MAKIKLKFKAKEPRKQHNALEKALDTIMKMPVKKHTPRDDRPTWIALVACVDRHRAAVDAIPLNKYSHEKWLRKMDRAKADFKADLARLGVDHYFNWKDPKDDRSH